jgi:hypothetical protein
VVLILDIALSEDFDFIELFPVSDLHLGSRLCNMPKFRKFTNMILAEPMSLSVFAEIYILGHVHKKTAHKAGIRVPDLHNNQVKTIDQLYVISSSYQSYGGYAAQKMLRPSVLGSVPIYLSGKEKYYEARI